MRMDIKLHQRLQDWKSLYHMWLPHVLERKVVNFMSCSVIGLTANCLSYILYKGSGIRDPVKTSILLDNRNLRGSNETNQENSKFPVFRTLTQQRAPSAGVQGARTP